MAEVRIGLIARGETSRGLGVQTQAIARELGVSAILTVDMATEYSSVGEVSAPGAESWTTDFDPRRSRISNQAMHWLIDRSDVIISVETFYDWRIPAAAERAGVKTVLIGNPEFFRADLPTPSAFWWPTEWMKQKLPRGTLMPHPAEPGHAVAPEFDGGVLKILHPVGRPALEDRNGTQLFMDMLGLLKVPVRATVTTMGDSPAALAIPNNVELVVAAEEKGDRWSIYKDQHLMIMPRKYGGLCLEKGTLVDLPGGRRTAIESVAVGDMVADQAGFTMVTARSERVVERVSSIKVRGVQLVGSVDHLHMIADSAQGELVPTEAANVTVGQWAFVPHPSGGIEGRLEMPPKPKVRALGFWPTHVDLDEAFMRMVGLFLAEGNSGIYKKVGRERGTPTIVWNFGPDAKYLADEVMATLSNLGIGSDCKLAKSSGTYGPSGTWRVRARSLWLYTLFQDVLGLGRGSFNKRMPDVAPSLVPALVGGWLDGDGCAEKRSVSGYSRSTAMINDAWRLMLKVGVLGSVAINGERLDVSAVEQARVVASWTRRLSVDESTRGKRPSKWVKVDGGWMAKVTGVAIEERRAEVVAIETESGTYIANGVLTHNCLPVIEALSCGLGAIMSECSPNEHWPVTLVPAARRGGIRTPFGHIPLHVTQPGILAKHVDLLHRQPETVAKMRSRALEWAGANDWSTLAPRWRAELERLCAT